MWPPATRKISASPGQGRGRLTAQSAPGGEHRRAQEAERQAALKAEAESLPHGPGPTESGRFTVKKQTGGDDVLFGTGQPRRCGWGSDRSGHKKETGIAATSWCPKSTAPGAYKVQVKLHHDRGSPRSTSKWLQPLSLNRAEAVSATPRSGLASAMGPALPLSLPDGAGPEPGGTVTPAKRHPSFQAPRPRAGRSPRFEALPSGAAPEPGGGKVVAGRYLLRPPMP